MNKLFFRERMVPCGLTGQEEVCLTNETKARGFGTWKCATVCCRHPLVMTKSTGPRIGRVLREPRLVTLGTIYSGPNAGQQGVVRCQQG